MKRVSIIIGVLLVVVALGVIAVMSMNGTPATNDNDSTSSSSGNNTATSATTIIYSSSGFSPAMVTVKSGETVAIKNETNSNLEFDSDPHPVHTDNTELNVDEVGAGQTKTFTVNTKGTFGYHNHLAPSEKGEIVVE